mmetsp:Transcript_21185/g.33291  ORF Transcript_21185/g.33291 Transcript_21185/m.33291 type:complete len:550 (+) Transcript_21185:52-1701(+)
MASFEVNDRPTFDVAACSQLYSERLQIAILDFGSQYSHLIARRVRELNVFCELYSCLVKGEVLRQKNIAGIILAGGPNSVYEEGAPHVDAGVWELIEEKQIPVFGICYGMQEITWHFGGEVAAGEKREYGKAMVMRNISPDVAEASNLMFAGIEHAEEGIQMWMSHGDKVLRLAEGFVDIAHTSNSEHAATCHPGKKILCVQFHPEVTHSPKGKDILRNFVVGMCNAPTDWNMTDIAEEFIREVREKVGPEGQVIGAVSGGVDSSVAAVLLQRAIGDRFHAILVDNGCLRLNESQEVLDRLRNRLGINLHCVDAADRFLGLLDGVEDPERKRKIIGTTFIDIFQEEANRIEGRVDFLLQGTLYPDVIESISYKGPSATIKSHHNVGGLPATMNLQLIEPLRELFKDEVRTLGIALGIEEESVWRHPFPGPGLAIRILGGVSRERADILRQADAILIEELHRAGIYREIGQAFCVLLPCKSVGVMGDGRTYENVCAVRCVQTTDYMTADWYHMPYSVLGIISNRIINEVRGINRVTYDISSKPPATIEWE